MRNILKVLKSKALYSLGAAMIFVGIISVTPMSWMNSYQSECPKELLK